MAEGERNIVVMGDLNEGPAAVGQAAVNLAPLYGPTSPLVEVYSLPVFNIGPRPGTFQSCGIRNRLDYIFVSQALAPLVIGGGVERATGLTPDAILDVGRARPQLSVAPNSWSPIADVYEVGDELVIEIELSGCQNETITTKIVRDQVGTRDERVFYISVEGRRDPVPNVTERFHNERWQGNFARLFRVPTTYDEENVTAAYSDGLLRIAVAKRPDESFQETTILDQPPKRTKRESGARSTARARSTRSRSARRAT